MLYNFYLKYDFQFVLRSLSAPMFINIISSHSMDVNRCYWLRTTYLIFEGLFNIFFPTASWIFKAANLFHQVILRERSKNSEVSTLRIYDGGCFETLDLLHINSCEMFHFCDFFREMKQKSANKSSRVHSSPNGNHLYKTYIYEVIIHNDCQITRESHG